MGLKPAVKNGELLRMVHPGGDVKHVPFDGPLPSKPVVGGYIIVTVDSFVGNLPFTILNDAGKTTITKVQDAFVVLLGARVRDVHGFIGTVEERHCTSHDFLFG